MSFDGGSTTQEASFFHSDQIKALLSLSASLWRSGPALLLSRPLTIHSLTFISQDYLVLPSSDNTAFVQVDPQNALARITCLPQIRSILKKEMIVLRNCFPLKMKNRLYHRPGVLVHSTRRDWVELNSQSYLIESITIRCAVYPIPARFCFFRRIANPSFSMKAHLER